jgi:hypothetical protein
MANGCNKSRLNKCVTRNKKMSRRTVALVDLKVIIRTGKGEENVPIPSSPFYQSLVKDDPDIHEKYIGDKHNEYWHSFQKTYRSIRDHGFFPDTRYRITVTDDNVILDGHHRVSILWHIYGQDLLLHINKNNQVYSINEPNSKKSASSKKASHTPTRSGKGKSLILYKKPMQTYGSRKPRTLQRKG